MMYIVEYTEEHIFSNFEGGFYGGLTICKREFKTLADAKAYVKKYEYMWEKNPHRNGEKYKIIEQ